MTSSRTASGPAVGRELAALGGRLASQGAVQIGGAFTDIPEADEFVRARPEAFLIAVLFTQGISAERAWAGPWLLACRLGHFDLQRLASERDAVARAVADPPALHRFVVTVAGWISDAAAIVLERYGGHAEAIWSDRPTAAELMRRFMGFPGIGRKKAAMAVELLSRCVGVEVADLEQGTVAYDTHVRRVFLRSGLVEHDTPEAVARAAAEACPAAPGRLDLPTWLIGRQWCHPTGPDCAACWLGGVCPRLTDRSVAGVGERRRRGDDGKPVRSS